MTFKFTHAEVQTMPSFVEQIESLRMQVQSARGSKLTFSEAAEVLTNVRQAQDWPSAETVPAYGWNVTELKERLKRDSLLLGTMGIRLFSKPEATLQGRVHLYSDIPGQAAALMDAMFIQGVLKGSPVSYVTDNKERATSLRALLRAEGLEPLYLVVDDSQVSILMVFRALCEQASHLRWGESMLEALGLALSQETREALLTGLSASASWPDVVAAVELALTTLKQTSQASSLSPSDTTQLRRLLRLLRHVQEEELPSLGQGLMLVCKPEQSQGHRALDILLRSVQHRRAEDHSHTLFLTSAALGKDQWLQLDELARTHSTGVWSTAPTPLGRGCAPGDHCIVLGPACATRASAMLLTGHRGWWRNRRLTALLRGLHPREAVYIHRGRFHLFKPVNLA